MSRVKMIDRKLQKSDTQVFEGDTTPILRDSISIEFGDVISIMIYNSEDDEGGIENQLQGMVCFYDGEFYESSQYGYDSFETMQGAFDKVYVECLEKLNEEILSIMEEN